jgi:transcriptional regulator with XRE-family HTH domain
MADVFRVPMEVTYAIQGGEPALMAYRRWRNISRDDLAAKSGIPRDAIEAIEDGKTEIEEAMLESLAAVLKEGASGSGDLSAATLHALTSTPSAAAYVSIPRQRAPELRLYAGSACVPN